MVGRKRPRFFGRLAGSRAGHDRFLPAKHGGLDVTRLDPSAGDPDFLHEDQPPFDDDDLLDDGDDGDPVFLAYVWQGLDDPADENPLDVEVLVSDAFVDLVLDPPRHGAHPHGGALHRTLGDDELLGPQFELGIVRGLGAESGRHAFFRRRLYGSAMPPLL